MGVIIGDHVYGYSGLSAQNRGTFKCLRLDTGGLIWENKDIGNGQFIYVEPYFLCLDVKGNLFLVDPSPEGMKIVAEWKEAIKTGNARSWTKPIIARGKLYLRYAHKLACYDI